MFFLCFFYAVTEFRTWRAARPFLKARGSKSVFKINGRAGSEKFGAESTLLLLESGFSCQAVLIRNHL
jgi:hypothetical protein